jgi:hypothetical protein
MKTSFNSTDGFYFFLLLVPFAVSLWLGDLLRIKIQASNWNHKLSIITGTCVEILVTSAGVLIGILLVKILAANT